MSNKVLMVICAVIAVGSFSAAITLTCVNRHSSVAEKTNIVANAKVDDGGGFETTMNDDCHGSVYVSGVPPEKADRFDAAKHAEILLRQMRIWCVENPKYRVTSHAFVPGTSRLNHTYPAGLSILYEPKDEPVEFPKNRI